MSIIDRISPTNRSKNRRAFLIGVGSLIDLRGIATYEAMQELMPDPGLTPLGTIYRRPTRTWLEPEFIDRVANIVLARIEQHQHIHLPEQAPNAGQLEELKQRAPEAYDLWLETTRKRVRSPHLEVAESDSTALPIGIARTMARARSGPRRARTGWIRRPRRAWRCRRRSRCCRHHRSCRRVQRKPRPPRTQERRPASAEQLVPPQPPRRLATRPRVCTSVCAAAGLALPVVDLVACRSRCPVAHVVLGLCAQILRCGRCLIGRPTAARTRRLSRRCGRVRDVRCWSRAGRGCCRCRPGERPRGVTGGVVVDARSMLRTNWLMH